MIEFSRPLSFSGPNARGVQYEISLTAVRADVRATLRHDRLVYDQIQYAANHKKIDIDEETARIFLYPSCIAGSETISIERGGLKIAVPVSVEDFLDLPPEFVDDWLKTVHDLNPRWRSKGAAEVTDEKKATKSSNG